ncbi:sigma factor-like helix-turn-helix DNA-binding protein [Granulicella cerasi]|uniref:Sigma factor-like helix-turn-helix DNA-binding protein n=1 Tax=Granulicella cerasi TaxID=741063 RepID=A0ABW1ZAG5_9BACT|nr:sigma factor-like helix-turn-helix DNA-binding protein [Granulicella cerasi]
MRAMTLTATAMTKMNDEKEQTVMMAKKSNVVMFPAQQRVMGEQVLREGSTGRVVVVPRMWAVGELAAAPVETAKPAEAPKPELAFYRKYTEAMLRRYLRMAMESGRVPSLLGRELFRSKVTSYRVKSFEDVIIFCFDMERCLAKLTGEEQELIKRIALQEYTHGEAAGMLGVSLRTVVSKYGKAIDRLTGMLLAAKMLEPMHGRA